MKICIGCLKIGDEVYVDIGGACREGREISLTTMQKILNLLSLVGILVTGWLFWLSEHPKPCSAPGTCGLEFAILSMYVGFVTIVILLITVIVFIINKRRNKRAGTTTN
jgi:FtsH-binding integral membrane protein